MTAAAAHIILIGMMGSGKTTVGAAVAARLDRPFVDTDLTVEAAAGRSIAEIFESESEAGFRDRELAAVADAIRSAPSVLALGGGAVTQSTIVASIGSQHVVWLRADPATLADRVGAGEGRPLLGDDPLGRLVELDRVRRVLYDAAATAAVDVDGRTVEEIVDEIIAGVPAATGGSP